MKKLEATIKKIEPLSSQLSERTQRRLDNLTKPLGSLGRLEELAKLIVCITGQEEPKLKQKAIIVMAGDHGVVAEGVSAYPQEVTSQMVYNFLRGGAGINVLARQVGARVIVVDMGVAAELRSHPELVNKKVAYGTKNMVKGPAMTREEAIRSVEAGIEVVEEELGKGIDIIGTGDMGIGNTTPSSAIVAAVTGEEVAKVTGRGTGIDEEKLKNKIKIIEKVLEVNQPDPEDGIDILAKIGGFEIGGMAGIMIASAANRIPVLIDGFISGAAALIAVKLEPRIKDYLIASHCSVEIGHLIALKWLGLKPLFDFDLRLGEGTGAAIGISIVEASVRILTEMATFGEAGVSETIT